MVALSWFDGTCTRQEKWWVVHTTTVYIVYLEMLELLMRFQSFNELELETWRLYLEYACIDSFCRLVYSAPMQSRFHPPPACIWRCEYMYSTAPICHLEFHNRLLNWASKIFHTLWPVRRSTYSTYHTRRVLRLNSEGTAPYHTRIIHNAIYKIEFHMNSVILQKQANIEAKTWNGSTRGSN